jgi:hypothetical protein
MNILNSKLQYLISLLLMLIAATSLAAETNQMSPPQGTQVFGDFEIDYSTFNSLIIPAVRAKDQQLINISVRRKSTGQAVPAKVEATAKNLLQQVKTIEFKTVTEPDTVYYLGTLRHANEETFHLDFSVTPADQTSAFKFRLTRKLYTEN